MYDDEVRKKMKELVAEGEGFEPRVYPDSKGIPSVGYGFNLQDKETRGMMAANKIDPDQIMRGEREISQEEADRIKDSIMRRKYELTRGKVGQDVFDTLPVNKRAVLADMGYQSLNNIGPKIKQAIIDNDDISAMREIAAYTNRDKSPGIQKRRLEQARQYNPESFNQMLQGLMPEEKQALLDVLKSTENEHTRLELLKQYQDILQPRVPKFRKLVMTD